MAIEPRRSGPDEHIVSEQEFREAIKGARELFDGTEVGDKINRVFPTKAKAKAGAVTREED